MTTKYIKDVLASNSSASHVLFHDGMFVAFGAEPCTDFVRIGIAKSIKDSSIYYGDQKADSNVEKCAELFNSVFALSDPALISSIRLNTWQIKFIQKTIKTFSATHLRLLGDENGVFAYFYDVLKLLPEARMNRSHETRVLTHQLKERSYGEFDVAFNASSFNLLPAVSFDLGIGKNHIGVFTDDENSDTYLLRDQEIQFPVINFFSDRLQQDICLSLNSSPLTLNPDTSQHETLLSEYEIEDL